MEYTLNANNERHLSCTDENGRPVEISDSQQARYDFPVKTMSAGYLGTGAQCFALAITTAHLGREPTEREWNRVLHAFVQWWPREQNGAPRPGTFSSTKIAIALDTACESDSRYPERLSSADKH